MCIACFLCLVGTSHQIYTKYDLNDCSILMQHLDLLLDSLFRISDDESYIHQILMYLLRIVHLISLENVSLGFGSYGLWYVLQMA